MKYVVLFCLYIILSSSLLHSQEILPVGSQPPALEMSHFPNKVCAVVWRNWNLIPVERVAEILGCTEKQVLQLGYDMGLPEYQTPPASWDQQMYITIVRRNWHLLPYEQLLVLLNMTAEELAFALKEDDFLYIKLGSLKPACTPVTYQRPDRAERKRIKEIRKTTLRFYHKNSGPDVVRLSFIDSLNIIPDLTSLPDNQDGLRYIYSYFGVFGDPLMNPELNPYPEGLLARLAHHGVNGVWLHVVLHQLIQEGGVFPELGKGSEKRLESLRTLVNQAAKYGISVYLYVNEPRAMPRSFFQNRPEVAGVDRGEFTTMCTSTETVSRWLADGMACVFREVPGLGGVFTITASENLTSCASHRLQDQCPRCSQRNYADIIADVNKAIEEGVHRSAPEAKVIVWDWGWYGHGDGREIIRRLPENVWQMSVSEWATPFQRGGLDLMVGEYSISVIGPGPRAKMHWAAAKERGLKTLAKVQLNNTWELSAVPWIPVPDLVAEHTKRLAGLGLDGYQLSWSLGGYPSPNLEIAHRFNTNPDLTVDEVLNDIAESRYGKEGVAGARKAWKAFSSAFQEFPYHISVSYTGPQQYGPASLLYEDPTGYKASMVGFPYDDLDSWRGPFPRESFVRQFEKVADGWKTGLVHFEKMIDELPAKGRSKAVEDYRIAEAVYLHFRSVADQSGFVMRRDDYLETGDKNSLSEMKGHLEREKQTAAALFDLVQKDSRIGFEASNQYYYVPQDLVEKVLNIDDLLRKYRTSKN